MENLSPKENINEDRGQEKRPESPELKKSPEEMEKERLVAIEENRQRVEGLEKSIEDTRSGLEDVRSKLGIPNPPETAPSIPNQMGAIDKLKTESEAEISPEMKKFKGEVEDMRVGLEALKYNLVRRTEYRLTDFFEDSDIQKLTGIMVGLNELDIYSDHELEKTNALLYDTVNFMKSIQLEQRGGLNEDDESLAQLVHNFTDVSEKAGNLEFAAKQVGTPASVESAKLSTELSEVSIVVARELSRKLEALQRYFGR
jgi:hypothetical protein